jgi:hypothetical protein
MDINNINNEEINNFMKKTVWLIEEKIEDDETEFNIKEIYEKLLDKNKNLEIIKHISDYDINIIKNIIDSYSLIKIIPVKITKYQEFNLLTLELNGLNDIKTSLDLSTLDKINELTEKYDINILSLTGGKYSLTIKQKKALDEDINEINDYIIEEIKKRCMIKNITFN